ncbi:RNA polymerase sigma-70 factor [Emticicia sediminis]
MTFSNLTDDLLIELLRDNRHEEKAFEEIYERYWKKLTSLAIFKTNSKEIAAEIVQEIFIKIWEKRHSMVIIHLESYLFTALKYQIISHLRTVISNRNITDFYAEPHIDSHETLTVDALKNSIENAIAELPLKTQQIFRMSRFDEKSHKEISSELDISEKSVEYHITQTLKVLREHLKDFFVLLLLCKYI